MSTKQHTLMISMFLVNMLYYYLTIKQNLLFIPRYLFNCGENFAQLVHYLDLSYDASKVFLTGRQWRHIGGLAGLHFLPQTITPSGIELFGPKGIINYMKNTDIFTKRSSVPECLITCTEYGHNKWNVYKDGNVTITPVLYPTQKGQSDNDTSVCYICEITELRGSFIPAKAEELKIPYGRWRNELHCGKAVTLPDGRTVSNKIKNAMNGCANESVNE